MITCHRKYLIQICRGRNYTLDEVMPCVVRQNGDMWTIDTKHPAYPMQSKAAKSVSIRKPKGKSHKCGKCGKKRNAASVKKAIKKATKQKKINLNKLRDKLS